MVTTTKRRPVDEIRGDGQGSSCPAGREDIARRAYERFEERGKEPGHDLDDWLRAERELEQPRSVE
jgi:hypothetical protein